MRQFTVCIVFLICQIFLLGNSPCNAKMVNVIVDNHDKIWAQNYKEEVEKVMGITLSAIQMLLAIILIFDSYSELDHNRNKILELEADIKTANKVNQDNTLESHQDKSHMIVFFENPILFSKGEGKIEKITNRVCKIQKNIKRLDDEIEDLNLRNKDYRVRVDEVRVSLTAKKVKDIKSYPLFDFDTDQTAPPMAVKVDVELSASGNVELDVDGGIELGVAVDPMVEVEIDAEAEVEIDAGVEVELDAGVEVELEANVEVNLDAEVELEAGVEVEVEAEAEA